MLSGRAPICFALIVLAGSSAAIQQDQGSGPANAGSDRAAPSAAHKPPLPPLSSQAVYAPELKVPSRARSRFQEGVKKHNAGHYREAAEDYLEAIRLYPPYSSAYTYRALALMKLKDFSGAEASIARALELNPLSIDAVRALGILLSTEDRMEEAKVHLERVIAVSPHDPKCRLLLALIAMQHRDHAGVVRHTGAIPPELGAEYHILFQLRGQALEALGRNGEALESYRTYLRLGGEDQPTSPAARAAIERLTNKESSALHPPD